MAKEKSSKYETLLQWTLKRRRGRGRGVDVETDSDAGELDAQRAVLAEALRLEGLQVICIDDSGSIVVSTVEPAELECDILEFLSSRDTPLADGARSVMSRGGRRYVLSCRQIKVAAGALRLVTVRERGEAAVPHAGITWLNADEVRERYESTAFGVVEGAQEVAPAVARAHAREAILMLEGEAGAGKRETAELVYLQGPYRTRPFVHVACDGLAAKSWSYLLKSQESPLYQEDITILIDDVQSLDERRTRELSNTVRGTSLARRCRVMLAANDIPQGGEAPQAGYLAEALACAVCVVPSVRERGGAAAKVARYLGYLAEAFGTEVPSVLPEAARALDAYSWPRNYLQLREVAERLYIMVGPGTIDAETVDEVLAQEDVIRTAVFSAPTLDTDLYIYRPLADTERDIARLVVDRVDGNKTRAAEVLGISRTTLWRLLKG